MYQNVVINALQPSNHYKNKNALCYSLWYNADFSTSNILVPPLGYASNYLCGLGFIDPAHNEL